MGTTHQETTKGAISPFDLTGKIALVTGASRGIGRACALALARAGADVALASRSENDLNAVAREIRAVGRQSEVFPIDMRQTEAIGSMTAGVEARFGRIDILVNNAGATHNQRSLELDEETWDRIIDTNLKAAFFCAQAAAKGMVERRAGKIVNMASTFSVVAREGRVAYCASKGGLLQMTRALALEFAPFNVQVNAIGPGPTLTEGRADRFSDPLVVKQTVSKVPAGRLLKPEDISPAAVFLASAAADMIVGQLLLVDGGYTVP
jgi:NAD(P)-dependent dehydrogenase (short-subunit alcohol dehydrogenase family)